MVRARYVLALPAALLLVLRCGASAGACADGSADATGACPGTSAEDMAVGARALRVPLAQLEKLGSPSIPRLHRRAHRQSLPRLLVRFRPAAAADSAAREYTLREVEERVEALERVDLGRFLPGARIAVVTLAPGADADDAVARLSLLNGERPACNLHKARGCCARRPAVAAAPCGAFATTPYALIQVPACRVSQPHATHCGHGILAPPRWLGKPWIRAAYLLNAFDRNQLMGVVLHGQSGFLQQLVVSRQLPCL